MKPQNNKHQTILLTALDALRRTTGLIGRLIEREPLVTQGFRGNALIEIEVNGHCHKYFFEIKRVDRFATLGGIKNQLGLYHDQALLVTPRVTTEIAEKCRELDLQFIDTAGNAYLHGPNYIVLVKGQRLDDGGNIQLPEDGVKRVGTATNLRVIFTLLCDPALLNAPYRAINQAAGVALGAVGWVFFDLNTRGYTAGNKGDRVLLNRNELVQEWATNYPIKLRQKLNPRRFRAPTTDWWKEVNITNYGAQWGGEVAAEKLTGYLRPQTFTIYLHNEQTKKNLTRMVADNKLRADAQGEIEILEAFWDFGEPVPLPETVPPLLAYADLIATLDPRNLEVAKLINEQYLTANETEA